MAVEAQFDQRVALVTGGARGIGKAIALALAQAGAAVAVNFRNSRAEAEAVVTAIAASGRQAVAVRANVAARVDVEAMIGTITTSLGAIDVLVNNAGVAMRREIDALSEADFDETIAVNLKSAFLCTQAVVGGMRERKWGRIVNISSGAARGAGLVGVHYNASKAGLEGLTRGYAARLAPYGITVNAVAPSLIQTDMTGALARQSVGRIPVGRMGQPLEVAQVVLMVLANPYMTGQTVQLNGGLHFN